MTDNEVVDARNKPKPPTHAAASSEYQKAQDALGMLGDVNQRVRGTGSDRRSPTELRLLLRACPFDGFVTNLNISKANTQTSAAGPTLVDNRNWYVLAHFREDLLDRIRPGM